MNIGSDINAAWMDIRNFLNNYSPEQLMNYLQQMGLHSPGMSHPQMVDTASQALHQAGYRASPQGLTHVSQMQPTKLSWWEQFKQMFVPRQPSPRPTPVAARSPSPRPVQFPSPRLSQPLASRPPSPRAASLSQPLATRPLSPRLMSLASRPVTEPILARPLSPRSASLIARPISQPVQLPPRPVSPRLMSQSLASRPLSPISPSVQLPQRSLSQHSPSASEPLSPSRARLRPTFQEPFPE